MDIAITTNLIPLNGGVFKSSGSGSHPERTIDSNELIFVVEGQLKMFEEDENHVLNAGDTLLLEGGLRHGGSAPYPPKLSFYWVHFKTEPLSGEKTCRTFDIPKTVSIRKPQTLIELFRIFLDNQESYSPDPGISQLTLLQILRHLVVFGVNALSGPRPKALVGRVESYLDVNARSAISTSSIAKALNVNSDYMGRVFKKATGRSVTRAIHERRVRVAKRLLMDNLLNISEIAYECGYSDLPHFRRMFKKIAGMTPSEYRGANLKLHINSE